MNTLIASQSIFYIVSSGVMIVLGVLLAIAIYQILRILKSTRRMSEDLSETYSRAKRGVKKIINLVKKE